MKAGQAAGSGTEEGHPDAPDTVSVKDLALGLPNTAWRTIKWREGSNEWLSSRFARLLVHVASSHQRAGKPTKEWLLIEWPEGEKEPTKCWLSTLPNSITFRDLVDAAKLRWRIERDYQECKQEVGLGHYEGRGCIAAYGFLVSERETILPQDLVPPRGIRNLPFPPVTDPADPPLRPERHVQTRSPPSADASSTLSLDACHDVCAVAPQPRDARV